MCGVAAEEVLFNEEVSEEEWRGFMVEFERKLKGGEDLSEYWRRFEALKLEVPRRVVHSVNSEDFVGDFVVNSKDVYAGFDVRNARGVCYSNEIFDQAKDSMDCSYSGEIELCYDCYEVHWYNLQFCNRTWPCSDSQYLWDCDNCVDCFGCVGLRWKKFCILNKQYSEEEYWELRGRIIEAMKAKGEYGEFFPEWLSPFGYDETVAMDYYPMTREEVLERGWNWKG